MDNGLDPRLAYHIGTLFRRVPIPVYEKELMFPCCLPNESNTQPEEKKESPKNGPEIIEEKCEDPALCLFGLNKKLIEEVQNQPVQDNQQMQDISNIEELKVTTP